VTRCPEALQLQLITTTESTLHIVVMLSKKGPKKKGGFFAKLKKAFKPDEDGLAPARSRTRDDGASLGTVATRTLSRASMFGYTRDKTQDKERELEERKSKCLAIQTAKRDPPAVQRLLVDCEFCNPPPEFGRLITIESPGFTAEDAEDSLETMQAQQREGVDLSDERTWNVGLDQWLRQREQWLKPTPEEQPQHFLDPELTPDRYYTVFDKMVYQTRPLKHPLNLTDAIKILKAGWVAEGVWVGSSQSGMWSSSDDEKDAHPTPRPVPSRLASNLEEEEEEAPSRISSPGPAKTPAIRVQFTENTGRNMPSLERVQSSQQLRPMRSAQSSVVSITDSD